VSLGERSRITIVIVEVPLAQVDELVLDVSSGNVCDPPGPAVDAGSSHTPHFRSAWLISPSVLSAAEPARRPNNPPEFAVDSQLA
jgi:hypothetical protein